MSAPVPRRRALAIFGGVLAGVAALIAAALAWLRGRGGEHHSGSQSPAPPAPATPIGTVLLDVADGDGGLLDLDGLLARGTNGAGPLTRDDALLDAKTLEVLALAPLVEHAQATAAVELPGGVNTCLTLSWPTSHGYSALMADLPAPGRYALAELAARGLHESQQPRVDRLDGDGADATATGSTADLAELRAT
ncbi:hypothetical protein RWX45_06770, partial [Actinomyces sp. MRS3W]|nr:hypothetical protein [Actinomyces sp. MRS3W]